MTAKIQTFKRRPRAPKRSGRKSGDLPIVTTELEPQDLVTAGKRPRSKPR